MESYSRVLESLAFNIVARIDDLLYVDDLSRHSDQLMSFSKVGMITRKGKGMSYKTGFSSPKLSWGRLRGDESPYIESSNHSLHGFGFNRIAKDKQLDSFMSASPSKDDDA